MGKSITIQGNEYLFKGHVEIPADKSISHRAVILSSLNSTETIINNILFSEDISSTISCFQKMGVDFIYSDNKLIVKSKGASNFSEAKSVLDCGNSGTTARLLSGILVGQNFSSILDGDNSLRRRPMKRIEEPLRTMKADISTNNGCLPIEIKPSSLQGGEFNLNLGSAQVKSAILFAGLYAEGETKFRDRKRSRNHTEIMLANFTENIVVNEETITIRPNLKINLKEMTIPSDPSSAAFFIVASLISKNTELHIKNVCLNPMRIHFIDILKKMGGEIEISNVTLKDGEQVGDITSKSSTLSAIDIDEASIPSLIDEIPILSLACTLAEGESTISGADELRFKESDRIKSIVTELKKFGCNINETENGIRIVGKEELLAANCDSHGYHRIAMMAAIAGTKASGDTTIKNIECVSISFPNFFELLRGFEKK